MKILFELYAKRFARIVLKEIRYNNLLDNSYETIYILKPDLDEDNILAIVQKYQQLLFSNNCHNIFVYDKGRKHLAYPIQKYHDGIYIQANYTASNNIAKILNKSFKIDENVMRHFTVKTV